MNGVVAIASKKGGWLPRKTIFEKNGFETVDQMNENYILCSKFFHKSVNRPSFYPISEEMLKRYGEGVTVLYTHQCPYTPQVLEDVEQFAENSDKAFRLKLIKSAEEASKHVLHPYGPFSILCDGETIPYKPGMNKKKLSDFSSV
jgi:hypothetical protein